MAVVAVDFDMDIADTEYLHAVTRRGRFGVEGNVSLESFPVSCDVHVRAMVENPVDVVV